MQKMTLDLERIEIVSFVTEAPEDADNVAAISGTACVTRPTIYGTCCTP
jgi:hypothetical protein